MADAGPQLSGSGGGFRVDAGHLGVMASRLAMACEHLERVRPGRAAMLLQEAMTGSALVAAASTASALWTGALGSLLAELTVVGQALTAGDGAYRETEAEIAGSLGAMVR